MRTGCSLPLSQPHSYWLTPTQPLSTPNTNTHFPCPFAHCESSSEDTGGKELGEWGPASCRGQPARTGSFLLWVWASENTGQGRGGVEEGPLHRETNIWVQDWGLEVMGRGDGTERSTGQCKRVQSGPGPQDRLSTVDRSDGGGRTVAQLLEGPGKKSRGWKCSP